MVTITRTVILWFACALSGVMAVAGQQPQRDPSQTSVRRVPVGTAAISGVVTAADTGRPLRGVRVTVNGVVGPPTRMGAPTTTLAPGVQGRIGMSVSLGGSASRTALTDVQGAFVIAHLPAGQYSVSASRNTFLTTNYGQKRPTGPGTSVSLSDGQKLALNLQLMRGGVITGAVVGEDGDPVAQAQVQLWRIGNVNGMKRLQRVNGASTDDRGAYRLSGLQPGEYIVSATVNNFEAMNNDRMLADTALIEQAVASGAVQAGAAPGFPATVALPMPQPPQNRSIDMTPPGYVPVFHPNTLEPRNATMLRVAGGDEHPFIDIQARLVQATNIVGTITNPPGQDLGVQLVLANDDLFIDSSNSARADPNGQFVFRNVPPGKYTILADVISSPQPSVVNGVSTQRVGPLPPLLDSQKLWGRDTVNVDGQPTANASVTLRAGRSISGVVVFEMARPPDLTQSRQMVTLSPAPDVPQMRFSPLPQAVVGADGRFTMSGVSPGRYQIRPPGIAKSAIVDGKDVLDFPFDFTSDSDLANVVLTVTDQTTEITGTLADNAGKPVPDYTVIIAPAEDQYWTPGSRRISFARTRADGQYRLGNLPPGNYMIAVVTDLESGMQYDVEFLKTLTGAGSARITIAEGEKVLRDLRVSR